LKKQELFDVLQGDLLASVTYPVTRCLLLVMAALAPQTGFSATGQALFESRCLKCHAPLDPHNYTADQWVRQLARMAPMAQLNPEESEAMLTYLQDNAGTEETALQEERQAFDRNCRGCHATVERNVPVAWRDKRLEERLMEHYETLEEAGKVEEELDEDQAHEIAEYLLYSSESGWSSTASSRGR